MRAKRVVTVPLQPYFGFHRIVQVLIRNLEKGAFAKGAVRKFVANYAPKLRVFCFMHQKKVVQNCRKLVADLKIFFGQFYANAPFPTPFLRISE